MENIVDINITMPKVEAEINADIKKVDFDLKIGKDGKSAYEIAVDNGFIGTEQEWLDSLKAANASYNSIYDFPNIGQGGVIYIDTSTNNIYRWDNVDLKYYCIGSDWHKIEIISGGNANG